MLLTNSPAWKGVFRELSARKQRVVLFRFTQNEPFEPRDTSDCADFSKSEPSVGVLLTRGISAPHSCVHGFSNHACMPCCTQNRPAQRVAMFRLPQNERPFDFVTSPPRLCLRRLALVRTFGGRSVETEHQRTSHLRTRSIRSRMYAMLTNISC